METISVKDFVRKVVEDPAWRQAVGQPWKVAKEAIAASYDFSPEDWKKLEQLHGVWAQSKGVQLNMLYLTTILARDLPDGPWNPIQGPRVPRGRPPKRKRR